MTDDRRLIEDYLPIQAISAEASREKSVRKGHISTLHLWWARRPLVVCRAAVYGSLVPIDRFRPKQGPEEKRDSLARANAAKFVERLCKYPGDPHVIAEAEKHILEAHAERLSEERGETVTMQDILDGKAPRPKVLDMFAGGGAIPLEALRLGCEAHALELNPVAHIIELCTLVYPQKYGKPDAAARGMTGPKNERGETTWGGLAAEVRFWGEWVLEKVREEIGDLYPPIPDPKAKPEQIGGDSQQAMGFAKNAQGRLQTPQGYLTPVAYLWTRTVPCKNPSCGGAVPLARQYWLAKTHKKRLGLRSKIQLNPPRISFDVEPATHDFDPGLGSRTSSTVCPYCNSAVDSEYVRSVGRNRRYGKILMAVVGASSNQTGKSYIGLNKLNMPEFDDEMLLSRATEIAVSIGTELPHEKIQPTGNAGLATGKSYLYGIDEFWEAFTPRQLVAILSFCKALRCVHDCNNEIGIDDKHIEAILSLLSLVLGKLTSLNSTLTRWKPDAELPVDAFGFQRFQMVWDFAEANPISGFGSSWQSQLDRVTSALDTIPIETLSCLVQRGSATNFSSDDELFDAIITDPPYYDNISYSELSDYFYVWMKRSIGSIFPEHFASDLTPKKQEVVAAAYRQGGSRAEAKTSYETMLKEAWKSAYDALKDNGVLVCVYAHKTTLGWATLVDSLRVSGFTVLEAWPLNTEMSARVSHQEDAALSSSIFIVANKRTKLNVGSYEDDVVPDLKAIIVERVDSLWRMGIGGADLVIAPVGAGLRAYTRFARVEYANGEEVPAEQFLTEVEGLTLETLLEKIFGLAGSGVGAVDGASRFYVLWRYAYPSPEMDAGEAIVFTYGQNVELDGPHGLSAGNRALVEKKKGKYRLLDFSSRGKEEKLGLPDDHGIPSPLIDTLHRILWLMENQPRNLSEYLEEVNPDRERLRLVAQVLAGTALEGSSGNGGGQPIHTTQEEHSALNKLLANWRSLMERGRAPRDDQQLGFLDT